MKKNRICVVMPTRGRPAMALTAVASIIKNSAGCADVLLVEDEDDAYRVEITGRNVSTLVTKRKPMLHLLNEAIALNAGQYDIFGFTGDDVLYQTKFWDIMVLKHLKTDLGVVYGDDGVQRANLPTHPFFSASLFHLLGFISPPGLKHYFFDNFLKAVLGPLNKLFYLPELKTQHLHHSICPETVHDSVYAEAENFYQSDEAYFNQYKANDQAGDTKKISDWLEIVGLIGGSTANPLNSRTPLE